MRVDSLELRKFFLMYFFQCLGDQQAALVGQLCFNQGDAKNTYVHVC